MANSVHKRTIGLCISFFLLLFLSAFTFAPSRAQDTQDDDVVRVETDLVVLNVTVVDASGNNIHGLRRENFKLFEDGKEQTISSFGAEETPFAAAILLDTSGSMELGLSLARSAAIRFLDGLRPEDNAAVYRFNRKVELLQEFSPSRDLAPLIFDIRADGATAMNDAIVRAAQDLAARPEKRRAIVVLSDGLDNRSSASGDKAMKSALDIGATIYTVDMSDIEGTGRRNQQNAAILREFASKTGGRFVKSPGGPELREAFSGIVAELGVQYTITYKPTNNSRDGRWRAVEVKLSRPELQPRTRKGYYAAKTK